jgi:hypothetical protein
MASFKLFEFTDYKDDKINLVNKHLPKPPFSWIISAKRNSGKTQLLFNILFNEDWGYNEYFDEMYLYCGSADDTQRFKRLAKHHKLKDKLKIEGDLNMNEINNIYNELEGENYEKLNRRVLIIIDDLIYKDMFSRGAGKQNILDRIFMNGRHVGLSFVITTQKFKVIGNRCRSNATAITCFQSQFKDLEAIAEEYHNHLIAPKDFRRLIGDYTEKKYTKFTIDAEKPDIYRDDFFQPINPEPYYTK